MLSPVIKRSLLSREPFLWLNHGWLPMRSVPTGGVNFSQVRDTANCMQQFAGLLSQLFHELKSTEGIIESPLYSADALQRAMMGQSNRTSRWLIKCDHALPVTGSIKARGGVYEVLVHARSIALRHGIMKQQESPLILASPQARALFSRHRIAVGSTGNLGLSIGVMAAALGFQVAVHMSFDAKPWKKARLRAHGVEVIEHDGDYGEAVALGRARAASQPDTYFVDDENSEHLFLGYSVAAIRLQSQLLSHGVSVDAQHPLFVYLPCGVGGAPGGITFGLRHVFGDHVHCFFAEPAASPCMLIRLAADEDRPIDVRDVGLDNCTEADGLAVGRASELVARMIKPLVSGLFTVADDDLFKDLYLLERAEGLRVEPSAAAGFRGPRWLLESALGEHYLIKHDLLGRVEDATHVLWTTGGALVPDEEYHQFHERGRNAHSIADRSS